MWRSSSQYFFTKTILYPTITIFILMTAETPNERNYRLLRERFLKEDRIVFSDGNGNEHTLQELKQFHVKASTPYSYHCRLLTGNEGALFLLKSPSNILRDEVADVIYEVEKEIMKDTISKGITNGYQLILVNYPNENYCELYFRNETHEYQIFKNEKMKIVCDNFDDPLEIEFENGHRIVFGNEQLSENELFVENENGIRYENGNEPRNGNENEQENGNGFLDMLHYSFNQIKKLL